MNAYGTPLTVELEIPNKSEYDHYFRIYTQKEVIMGGVTYYVIASQCYDDYDPRNNYCGQGMIHVSLLAYKKADSNPKDYDGSIMWNKERGPIYLLSGDYHYCNRDSEYEDNFSTPGYPTQGTLYMDDTYNDILLKSDNEYDSCLYLEKTTGPGLKFHSAVRLADSMDQLSSIYNFKNDLAFIASHATELSLNFNTYHYNWDINKDTIYESALAKMGMKSVVDIYAAIRERVQKVCMEYGIEPVVEQVEKEYMSSLNIRFHPETPFPFLQALFYDKSLFSLIRDSSPIFFYNDFQVRNPVNGKRWYLRYGVRTYRYFGKKNADFTTKRNSKVTYTFPA